MKTKYILFMTVLFTLAFSVKPLSLIAANDTIAEFPFTEDWSSGSFATNGWTFPWGQGNWAISTGTGNPFPCAEFTGHPSNSNYIYALESPVFDARGLTCDELYLGFDMELDGINYTGMEKLKVTLITDTTEFVLYTYANSDPITWRPEMLNIRRGAGHFFKVRFTAYGSLSTNISNWRIDNITVLRKCKKPSDLYSWSTGDCGVNNCYTTLVWSSPLCEQTGELWSLIYDDGSAENGWAINPGYTGWLGNEFPLPTIFAGTIQSLDVWFGNALPGSEHLTIDIFDNSKNYVGSSDPFIPPADGWLTVPCNGIPFSGKFYAMVKWENVATGTNFFGYDENGPYSADDLEWYYDGITWDKMTNAAGAAPGVFMIRATVLMSWGNGVLSPGKPFVPVVDSSSILGYNVYRDLVWSGGVESGYTLIGFVPAPDTIFHDTISCLAYYFVTAVYANNCESGQFEGPTYTGCFIGIPEPDSKDLVQLTPNPANASINIRSDSPVRRIGIIGMTGKVMLAQKYTGEDDVHVDISGLPCGIYIIRIETLTGISNRKLCIQR